MQANGSYIIDDKLKGIFLLDRSVHVSEEILREEMQKIFSKCWIYVGHASELKKNGDFVTRKVAGRPIIFARDQKGEVRCHFNTCRHRGATVCLERTGNARRFMCVYHGWIYNNDGSMALNLAIRSMKEAGRAVMIMAHRPAAIQECDLLMVLEDGARRAFGPRDAVLREMVKNHTDIVRSTGPGGVS